MVILTNDEILDELRKFGITSNPELMVCLVDYKTDYADLYINTLQDENRVMRVLERALARFRRLFRR